MPEEKRQGSDTINNKKKLNKDKLALKLDC